MQSILPKVFQNRSRQEPGTGRETALGTSASVLGRQLLRIAVAFLVYLILQRFWILSGLEQKYDSLVMGLAAAIFLPTQHFPIVPSLDNLSVRNLDFVIVFTLSLFLVSTAVPWRRRLKQFVPALVVIYCLHVLTVILQVKVTTTLDLNRQYGLLILLPWEFKIVERLKYLLYDLGLQAGPFILALLTVAWNSGLSLPPRSQGQRSVRLRLTIGAVSLIAVVAIGLSWSWWREDQPLHVGAHATLGRIYQQNGNLPGAEHQYRVAIKGGTAEPLVFYDLAAIARRSGRKREALDTLVQGQRVTSDPLWRARFERAIAELRQDGL